MNAFGVTFTTFGFCGAFLIHLNAGTGWMAVLMYAAAAIVSMPDILMGFACLFHLHEHDGSIRFGSSTHAFDLDALENVAGRAGLVSLAKATGAAREAHFSQNPDEHLEYLDDKQYFQQLAQPLSLS
jgi:hypothetical protein